MNDDHNGKTAAAATTPGTGTASTSDAITVITSIDPKFTGKTFSVAPDGSQIKHVVAWIKEGEGRTIEVPTAAAMVKVLGQTTQSANQALVLSRFNGDDAIGQPFQIVTERALETRLGRRVEYDGVYKIGKERVAARVKRGMQSSEWVLLDADNPPGMSDEWRVLTLAERLVLLEKFLPGISKCERVEYRGSSARVVKGADKPPEPTHALIRVSDASKIEILREWLKVETVTKGLSFKSPRYSRINLGQIIGHERRTLIDLAVLVCGRLVFNAKPRLAANLAGYNAVDAGIRIVNRGGGALDIGFAKLPDAQALENYRQKTGMRVTFSERGSLSSTVIGALKPETEIEVRGVVKPLAEWTATMSEGEKLRCETPFRASCSEAAFITIDKGGDILLHDVGTATNYVLRKTPEFPEDIDLSDDEPDEIDETLIAQKMPDIDPKAFYGPLAAIVEAATKNSEATRIGVGLQIIAQVSMCLRPFYAPLGDQRLPLNVFALQVGQSSRGRKGTSAAFADNFLAPAIRTVVGETQWSRQLAAADAQALTDARAAVTEAMCRVEWTLFVTQDDAKYAADKIAALQSEKAALERQIVAWTAKLTAKVYSPDTTRKHKRLIAEGEARIENLKQQIAAIEAEKARVEAVLMDRAGKVAEADQAVVDAKAAVSALPMVAPVEPWQELFGALAAPPVTLTGVSSGEGLIHSIRDPRAGQGDDDQRNDPGSVEKRLLVNMSEFGSVLALVRRMGSTLSAVLRNLYDCVPVETAAKVSPVSCAQPFATLSASITPQELKGLMFDKRDVAATADNGLGNRFLYLFVARDKLVPNPLPTENCDALTRVVAENIRSGYAALKPVGAFLSTPIEFTPEAVNLYEREIYIRIDGLRPASQNAARLFNRMTTNLRKLAAILAVIAGESRISVGALEAAVAWIEYAAATVNVIASTVEDRRQMLRLHEDGEAVLGALKDLGADLAPVSQRDARRKANLDAARFKGAVGRLLREAPAPIAVDSVDVVTGNGAKRKKTLLRLV
jgi:hypothetical protein